MINCIHYDEVHNFSSYHFSFLFLLSFVFSHWIWPAQDSSHDRSDCPQDTIYPLLQANTLGKTFKSSLDKPQCCLHHGDTAFDKLQTDAPYYSWQDVLLRIKIIFLTLPWPLVRFLAIF